MAGLLSSPSALFPGFQRSNYRFEIPSISMLKFPTSDTILLTSLTTCTLRPGNPTSLHWRRRPAVLFASETNPSDQDALEEKADAGSQSPPFLTILAGLVVFLFICWIIGSIVMWLIGLIVHV